MVTEYLGSILQQELGFFSSVLSLVVWSILNQVPQWYSSLSMKWELKKVLAMLPKASQAQCVHIGFKKMPSTSKKQVPCKEKESTQGPSGFRSCCDYHLFIPPRFLATTSTILFCTILISLTSFLRGTSQVLNRWPFSRSLDQPSRLRFERHQPEPSSTEIVRKFDEKWSNDGLRQLAGRPEEKNERKNQRWGSL